MGPYTKLHPKPSNKNTKTTIPLLVKKLKKELAESKKLYKQYLEEQKYTASLFEIIKQNHIKYILDLIKNGIEK